MKRALVLIFCTVLLQGCSILHHDLVGNDAFPAGYETLCKNQLAAAKAGIERCGTSLKREQAVEVYLHKGTKKFNGMWCWEWSPGYYVAGMTLEGRKIEVGCSPQYKEVNSGVLFHEFGHYWLITNTGDHSHNAKYDSVFHWSGLAMGDRRMGSTNTGVTVDTPAEIAPMFKSQ
jgi:hypothetical protein